MSYLFTPSALPVLPIIGRDERFPVRRIYCVGRNYAAHALEMGGNPEREPPFFFSKPADALVQNGSIIAYPPATDNFHFEMELVIAINGTAKNLSVSEAVKLIFGYASGIDLTRRDLQSAAKEKGRPWDCAKGFDFSAPCSAIAEAKSVPHIENSRLWLNVNGQNKQQALISDMIWNPPEIVAHLSKMFELKAGDLIYTGTPAGVGPLQPGDHVNGGIEGLPEITIDIIEGD